MKKLALILLCLALVGCKTTHSSLTPPNLDTIDSYVGRASSAIDTAEVTTSKVIKYGAMKNDPEVIAMGVNLKKANGELAGAKAEIKKKQGEVDEMTKQSNKVIDRLNYLEPKYAAAVGVIWRWRFIAIGSWLAFAAYLAAKFYFKLGFL